MGARPDFAAIFDLSPNPYMVLDRELRFVAANGAYLRTTSRSLEELLGKNLFDAFPHDPHDARNAPRTMLRESLERVLATGRPDSIALIPYRVAQGDGAAEIRRWSATHTPILDENGRVRFILQHTVDVTEVEALRHAAQAGVLARAEQVQRRNVLLDEERRHLRSLFEQAPGFICILRGPEHVIEMANRAYFQLVGHRELLGRRVREAVPEVEGQGWFELLERVYKSGEPLVGHGARLAIEKTPGAGLDEVFVDFVYQPIFDEGGAVAGIFVQGNDVTSQKRLEQERIRLLESERQARARAEQAERTHHSLAQSIPQQIWTAAQDGALDFVTDSVVEYFGVPSSRVLGDGWQEFVHPDDAAPAAGQWSRSLRSGEDYEIEFRLRRADGAYRWHLARARAGRNERGEVVKWFGTNTDIDEARKSRDELHRRAELEEQLIAIVSHDLRNPLQAIAMSGALLLRYGHLDARQGKAVARILSSTERATRLIGDFLDFTRARSTGSLPVQPAWTNLRELTQQVVDEVSLAHPERAITVEHHGAEESGSWDPDRIAQVIGNLVGNAVQHSPGGGPVRVVTFCDASHADLSVHNEGPPIPAADLARLFEPFVRGRDAGEHRGRSVGLGLYIARQIVAAHAGTIDVRSKPGEGTTFAVRLPRGALTLVRSAANER